MLFIWSGFPSSLRNSGDVLSISRLVFLFRYSVEILLHLFRALVNLLESMIKRVALVFPSSTAENLNNIQLEVSNYFVSHKRFYLYQIDSSDQIIGANCKFDLLVQLECLHSWQFTVSGLSKQILPLQDVCQFGTLTIL